MKQEKDCKVIIIGSSEEGKTKLIELLKSYVSEIIIAEESSMHDGLELVKTLSYNIPDRIPHLPIQKKEKNWKRKKYFGRG